MAAATPIPEQYRPAVEEIVAARIKEHNAGEWAKGINGVLKHHSEAIEELSKQVGQLTIAIDHMNETSNERAAAAAERLGIPMLSPNRKLVLTELLDQAQEDKLLKKRADKRENFLQNRLVQLGIGIAILYQLLGITAALYNAFVGTTHHLFGP